MSLTVNALRKLQQTGAFPAPKDQDGQPKSPETPGELPVDKAETDAPANEVKGPASTETNLTTAVSQLTGTATEPFLEREPPVSPESERETHEKLPTSHPLDEEDLNVPAAGVSPPSTIGRSDTISLADQKQFDDQKTLDLPLLDSICPTPASSTELQPPQSPGEAEHSLWTDDPAGGDTLSTEQAQEVETEASNETPLPRETSATLVVPDVPSMRDSDPSESPGDDGTTKTQSLDVPHAAHDVTIRDHVSNRSDADDESAENESDETQLRSTLGPARSDDRPIEPSITENIESIEPSITENIESIEQILQDGAESGGPETEIQDGRTSIVEPEVEPQLPENPTQPIPRDGDSDTLIQSIETHGHSAEAADRADDAYNPVIQPLYELSEARTEQFSDLTVQPTSQSDPSMPAEAEPIQAELVQSDQTLVVGEDQTLLVGEPNHRIPAPGADLESQIAKFDPDAIIASPEPQEEVADPIPVASSIGTPVETAYEREVNESLAKPDVEKQFMDLCNQIYARSQYKLPSSLLLVTPQQTGRIADTLAHLSVVLERDGRQLIMLDANLEEQGLTRRYEAVGKLGLCDVLTGRTHPADVVLPTASASIRIVPCGDDISGLSRTPNSVDSHHVRSIVQTWTLDDSTVICDAGSMQSALALPLSEAFDAVLLVVSMEDLDLDLVREATKALSDRRAPLLGCITTDA